MNNGQYQVTKQVTDKEGGYNTFYQGNNKYDSKSDQFQVDGKDDYPYQLRRIEQTAECTDVCRQGVDEMDHSKDGL